MVRGEITLVNLEELTYLKCDKEPKLHTDSLWQAKTGVSFI